MPGKLCSPSTAHHSRLHAHQQATLTDAVPCLLAGLQHTAMHHSVGAADTVYEVVFVPACRQALFKAGAPAIWAKVLKGAARSSAFLAMYCTLCWRGACLGFQATGSCAPQVIAASAWPGAVRVGPRQRP